MTDSSTGGYLLSSSPAPFPGNLSFKKFLQTVFVGVSGLPGDLVRPRWQVNPPGQPDILVNWMALGVTVTKPDANAFVGVSLPTYARGTIELQCNPIPGETLTVNGVLITFVSALTVGNQVLIGLTSNDTTNNLHTFLQGSSIGGLLVASYSVYWNVVTIIYGVTGAVGNAFTLASVGRSLILSGPTLSGGNTNGNIMQRHEDLEVQCSFYGPDDDDYAGIVRDGFQIPQNLEALRSVNMGFVNTSQAIRVPDLVNERWMDRLEMSVFLRREIMRSYPILTLLSVSGSVQSSISDGVKTVNWSANV